MIHKFSQYNNVRQFWLFCDNIITENYSKIIFQNRGGKINCKSYYPTLLEAVSGSYFLYDHPVLSNIDGVKLFQVQDGYGLEAILSDRYLCIKRHEEEFDLKTFSIFENENKLIESEYLPINNVFLSLGYIFFNHINHENLLSCYSISTAKGIWQQNFDEILSTKGVSIYTNRLQVIGNKLFLFAHDSNWEKYATFCLDADTGEVLKRIEMGVYLYAHENMIYTIGDQSLTLLDPKTYEMETINLADQLQNLVLDDMKCYFYKDKLYFAAKPDENTAFSVVGILDLKSSQLQDSFELLIDPSKPSEHENRYWIQEIKANDHLLAVHTSGGDLHVFEIRE